MNADHDPLEVYGVRLAPLRTTSVRDRSDVLIKVRTITKRRVEDYELFFALGCSGRSSHTL